MAARSELFLILPKSWFGWDTRSPSSQAEISPTAATLVPCVPVALRLDKQVHDTIPYYMLMLDHVRRQAHNFDILHFHVDFFPFPLFRSMARRTVTTLHGRQDLPDLPPFYRAFDDMPLVSISDAQRLPLPQVNFAATIYHGLPLDLHRPTLNPRGGYVAFLGRISPEKGPERAIHIARSMGIPIKIAAKVDRVDEAYFRECIAPLLNDPDVEFIGEINERQKTKFLGEALALVFPIDWPEPFGLAMIEAMACGTPVLAFRRGSVPEIIDEGVTGVIVDGMEHAPRRFAPGFRPQPPRCSSAFHGTLLSDFDGAELPEPLSFHVDACSRGAQWS